MVGKCDNDFSSIEVIKFLLSKRKPLDSRVSIGVRSACIHKLKIEIEKKEEREREKRKKCTRNEAYNSIICHEFREREPSTKGRGQTR